MGYRGKQREQEEARRLRAQNKTLQQIADELGGSKSSVSIWVRDVPFTPSKRRYGPRRRPHPAHERKLREIEHCNRIGLEQIGELSEREFLMGGVALYAGEGSNPDLSVGLRVGACWCLPGEFVGLGRVWAQDRRGRRVREGAGRFWACV